MMREHDKVGVAQNIVSENRFIPVGASSLV